MKQASARSPVLQEFLEQGTFSGSSAPNRAPTSGSSSPPAAITGVPARLQWTVEQDGEGRESVQILPYLVSKANRSLEASLSDTVKGGQGQGF